MIFDVLSNAAYRVPLRSTGAELKGGLSMTPSSGGGKSRGPVGHGTWPDDLTFSYLRSVFSDNVRNEGSNIHVQLGGGGGAARLFLHNLKKHTCVTFGSIGTAFRYWLRGALINQSSTQLGLYY